MTYGANDVVCHIVCESARLVGMQTVAREELAMLVFDNMVSEIPSAHSLGVFFRI
jgi:hypothetical protein